MSNELPTKMNWCKKDHRWHLELTSHDTALSRLVLLRTSMRFGHAPLSAGGIAGVQTEEEFRHQGHARTILQEAIREMNRRRYALSLLYGINDMYGKFGYATVESVPQIQIDLDEVLLYPCDRYVVRPFSKRNDSTRLVRYYNQANSDRNGTAVRTESVFRETRDTILVATDGRDRLLGYAIYEDECDDDDDRFHVWEIEAKDESAYYCLLGSLAKRAKRLGAKRLNCWMIENHPFTSLCRRYRSNFTSYSNRNGGGMARIVDVAVLAKQMLPELSKRWRQSKPPLKGLSIRTDIGAMKFRATRSGLALDNKHNDICPEVSIPQDRLVQLLMGYRTVGDIAVAGDSNIPSGLVHILEGLFPSNRSHGAWYTDQF